MCTEKLRYFNINRFLIFKLWYIQVEAILLLVFELYIAICTYIYASVQEVLVFNIPTRRLRLVLRLHVHRLALVSSSEKLSSASCEFTRNNRECEMMTRVKFIASN